MAMKKEPRGKRHPLSKVMHEHHKTPDELAPPEEQRAKSDGQGSNNGGASVFDTGALKLPSEFTEKGEEGKRLLGLEPVALVIITFALIFISFIAYLISIEPPKADEEPKPTIEAQPK